ncbi:SDR family oxidoreductase [Paenibacillus mendelii]|uniref:SDR family oxidoreductase n=1 Tax=Paenibacillus mendelii TaxID=206163 RepID=A0ABV6JG02_9BACL|nr:SDR family oxidoreductase [Paenibacillus mendelii]MCQ6557727.1 SDR family oxidoreductase [Paenibacillus mendelii]
MQGFKQEPRGIEGKVAFVTGTSSGIGLLSAVALAHAGYRVVASMRDLDKSGPLLESASRQGVAERLSCVQLDVTDHAAIDQTIEEIAGKLGGIDLLVNNAGFAVGGYVEEVPMEAWRAQMETNFFGLVAVSRSIIPIMRRQRSGHIINISSLSGRFGFPGYAPYAASKFAVEGFSEALRHELLPFGVHVILVEPGAFKTSIWQKGFEQIYAQPDSPYQAGMEAVLRYSRKAAETSPDPQQVAELIVRIARTEAPHLRYPVGNGARMSLLGKALLPWKWFERVTGRMLR